MAAQQTENALIVIDFINDIVDPKGKLAAAGYADFAGRHDTFSRVQKLLGYARANNMAVIHVKVGFSPDYREQPEHSPLFANAKKFGALQLDTWACEFVETAKPLPNEPVVIKHRVNAFHATSLELLLTTIGVKNVTIIGCSTDITVQTTARDAHDRDYTVTVIGDCCIAANDDDHTQTLRMMKKIARVINLEEFLK